MPLLTSHLAEAQDAAVDGGVGPDTVFYELRVYDLNPDMQPKILSRFKQKETAIFRRLGMQPVAYWVATDGPAIVPGEDGTLIYLLRHRSRDAATASWAKFKVDSEWVDLKSEPRRMGSMSQPKNTPS